MVHQRTSRSVWPHTPHHVAKAHVLSMLDKICESEIQGEKAHRWIGWAQCAMVMSNTTTFHEVSELNRKYGDDEIIMLA